MANEADKTIETQRLPIIEERVAVGKTVREGRTVTVRTKVRREDVEIAEDLRRETIEVRRVPVGKVVDAEAQPREENGTTIIPVYEEQLVVSRQLVLVEEIHLIREAAVETARHRIPRAYTEVEIEGD